MEFDPFITTQNDRLLNRVVRQCLAQNTFEGCKVDALAPNHHRAVLGDVDDQFLRFDGHRNCRLSRWKLNRQLLIVLGELCGDEEENQQQKHHVDQGCEVQRVEGFAFLDFEGHDKCKSIAESFGGGRLTI